MANTGFKITDAANGWNKADFNDVFINKDCFVEGNLWAWGSNSEGRLGNNNTIARSSPVQTISGGTNWRCINRGTTSAAAIKSDGSLWVWGRQDLGQLGNNTAAGNVSSPIQTISGGTNWKEVQVGSNIMAAIKSDGTLWTWGSNTSGGLGNQTSLAASSPVQTISGGNNWKKLSLKQNTVTAIKTDGTLWGWGRNNYGVLGNNTTISVSSPVQTTSSGTNWRQISTGGNHAGAIKTDGTLWMWGRNNYGMLGDSTSINKSVPTQIDSSTSWKSISTGSVNSAAIKNDGSLWLWGRGEGGALGNSSTLNRSSPVQTVSAGTNWREISAGGITAGIKTDGTLWAWGCTNFYNSGVGDDTTIVRSSPVQTISGGTNWRNVNAYRGIIASIRDAGTIY